MKICCCSRSFEGALHSGALTQLEWVDRCAELALDGVDFAAAHFPRTDDDYLAQLKKLCADRGLTIAACTADGGFGSGDIDPQIARLNACIDLAAVLGAPLVRFACGAGSGSAGVAWRELIRGLKHVTLHAKERNVTLALQPDATSLVASASDAKRAIKECDSAWLRLALPLDCFAHDAQSEWPALFGDVVLAVAEQSIASTDAARRAGYVGFVTLDLARAPDPDAGVREALGMMAPS